MILNILNTDLFLLSETVLTTFSTTQLMWKFMDEFFHLRFLTELIGDQDDLFAKNFFSIFVKFNSLDSNDIFRSFIMVPQ